MSPPEPTAPEPTTPEPPDRGSSGRGSLPQRHLGRYGWALAALALLLAIWGIASRVHARNALATQASSAAAPIVTTQHPTPSPSTQELILPGNVQAFFEAPIYARTSGYLRGWYADIGTHVRKGQLLADIDTPEVDQQLEQAVADLGTAKASAQLARTTNQRWKALLVTRSVSQQDADSRASDAATTQAAEAAALANVNRLRYLESFKHVVAPFDGVVTQRNTDIGDLIGAGATSGAALFRVADIHKLRIYVLVPEPDAAAMVPGLHAQLRFAERPRQNFDAMLVSTANALDPSLRTLQVQLQADNPNGELFPGAYAEVHFRMPGSAGSVRIPVDALVFRSAGLQVAVLGADRRAHLRTIVPGRDFGTSIEVLSGLTRADAVIVNPPDSLTDGEAVRLAAPPAAQGGAPQRAAPRSGGGA
ncbi:MAG TPA: efflux RND transporter periplasmic adaptor subunit [Steroidobacteraceae bacterium]|jgi:RND family efflux transporter MFP subunit|nr:efflux RND transporter periplasmic adaptor subunit [Steroidobacteraceae bacterium]